MNLADTIVAIATPPGRGGIGMVRLSGPRAAAIAGAFTRFEGSLRSWSPHRAELLDTSGRAVDDILITLYSGPRSYTGEDVIELSCHGAPVVLRHAVEQAMRHGARLAEPGEFTLRAFLNGRIDLAQAEAVRDLIDATTMHQARIAAQQAGGSLARQVKPAKAQLVDLIALLEAGIDFAEDDISVAGADELRGRLDPIVVEVERLARSFTYGRVLREGFTLAIVGRPNVGKSSLFNRLLEQDRAIVTPIPGTTRDLVSEVVAMDGVPVRLIDTAGIRQGQDLVETLGIERSYDAMADADLTLVVVDATAALDALDRELIAHAQAGGRALLAANKIDAGAAIPDGATAVSARTGQGIEELRSAILEAIAPGGIAGQTGTIVTSLRQQNALETARAALAQARRAIDDNIPHEMLLLDLYMVLAALDELTGKTTADDILHKIFSTFCIGK